MLCFVLSVSQSLISFLGKHAPIHQVEVYPPLFPKKGKTPPPTFHSPPPLGNEANGHKVYLGKCRHFWFSSSYKNDPHKLGADTAYAKLCFIMMLQHELLMFLVICLILGDLFNGLKVRFLCGLDSNVTPEIGLFLCL